MSKQSSVDELPYLAAALQRVAKRLCLLVADYLVSYTCLRDHKSALLSRRLNLSGRRTLENASS